MLDFMTLTFHIASGFVCDFDPHFSRSNLKWPYLQNGFSGWYRTEAKLILDGIFDIDIWPWHWPWPWIFIHGFQRWYQNHWHFRLNLTWTHNQSCCYDRAHKIVLWWQGFILYTWSRYPSQWLWYWSNDAACFGCLTLSYLSPAVTIHY